MSNRVMRFSILPEDDGRRIDQVLAAYSDELSRTRVRKLIDIGGVHLAGRRVSQCSRSVQSGEQLEVFIDALPLRSWELTAADILYEDRDLLFVNKPAGIDTQPTPARFKGTVYHALRCYLGEQRGRKEISLGMVQRLDRGTSGVMVFSIHKRAHKGLSEELAGRRAAKHYLALVAGEVRDGAGEFSSQLARNRATNLVRSVSRGGKEALTRFRVLQRLAGVTLVEVELVTGRMHQIRAHFAEAGHPLLGDVRYGGPAVLAGYRFRDLLLHSRALRLRHPVTAEQLEIVAPLPDAWFLFWKQLGSDCPELASLI